MFYPYGSRINYWDNYDMPPSAVFFEMILTPSRFTLPGARPDLLRPAGRPHHPGPGRHIAPSPKPPIPGNRPRVCL